MASTSGLLDLTTHDWDEELLATLGIDEERLPRARGRPALERRRLLERRRGLHGRERAALMVGTSGALRVLYESERPQPKPGLFLYLADERHVVEGGALSDGGNLYDWLERTLADSSGSLAERDPRDHGLVFLPFLGGERSTGWNPRRARRRSTGSPSRRTPLDLRQAAYEGVAFRFAAVADLLPEVREVVATGGGLLRDRDWIQIMADALARPIEVSGVPEASLRGAAVLALERLGHEVTDAAIAGVVEPRRRRGRGLPRRARGAGAAVRRALRAGVSPRQAARSGGDAVGVDAGLGEQLGRLARVRHLVHREPDDRRPLVGVAERREHGLAEPALGPVILDRDDRARERAQRLGVERLDRVEVDHARLDPLLRERVRRLQRLVDGDPRADDARRRRPRARPRAADLELLVRAVDDGRAGRSVRR